MRSIDELANEICTLTGQINVANHRWLLLIAEFDRRAGWSDGLTQSCAHWLNWKCGIAMGAAREKVRVARALENLPKVSAAMATGQISYSKVREITRIGNGENEDFLLEIAAHGTASHVEKVVRAHRRCQDAEELSREACQRESRALSYRWDDDGSLVMTCRLPAEDGARLVKALDLAVEDVPAGTSGERIPFAARRADALALIAESFQAHGLMEVRGTDRHQIVVHVAEETLRARTAGCCEFEHGPSMAAETARRFACDASVIAMIESDEGEPLNVGRKTRTISTPLRRVLNARDNGCRFPGCCNSRFIDAHHIEHWANGGETRPDNLVSLCRFHHRAVHEGGVRIERLDDGALRFVKPDGAAIDLGYVASHPHAVWQPDLAASTPSSWRGDRMDYGLALDILFQQTRKLDPGPRCS
jgi:hypothetical protein